MVDAITIIYENAIDEKARSLCPDGYELKYLSYFNIIRELFSDGNKLIHFRYLRLVNPYIAVIRYLVLIVLIKIAKVKIVWSMHNFWEHKSRSRGVNIIVRRLLWSAADNIVVFHESIRAYIPKKYHHKVSVACFGGIKDQVVSRKSTNSEEFKRKYNEWQGANSFDLIIVSTAKINNYYQLISNLADRYNILVVNQNDENEYSQNGILCVRELLFREIPELILKNRKLAISVIMHENISVPTSIYYFAELGIPILTSASTPNRQIISKYQFGQVVSDLAEADQAVRDILQNYSRYQQNCLRFISENTWEKGRSTYERIYRELINA